MQQGRYAGNVIASRVAGRPAPSPFRYFDKGNLAVIGRKFAVLESGRVRSPDSRRGACGPASTSRSFWQPETGSWSLANGRGRISRSSADHG
jgi:hypothetical protein